MFDHGVTVLFVSHSLAQVKRLCNKAILLEHGQLIAKGDIGEVSAIYEAKLDEEDPLRREKQKQRRKKKREKKKRMEMERMEREKMKETEV